MCAFFFCIEIKILCVYLLNLNIAVCSCDYYRLYYTDQCCCVIGEPPVPQNAVPVKKTKFFVAGNYHMSNSKQVFWGFFSEIGITWCVRTDSCSHDRSYSRAPIKTI